MKIWLYITICCLYSLSVRATDAGQFEKSTGLKGSYNDVEKVFKVSFPRTDIRVSINGFPLDPFMGLTSWAAFSPISATNFIVMGDLVLFEDEVNPVMDSLFENHLNVTALHNHFFFDQPKVYFMHIAGTGSLDKLSNGVKGAMETIKQIRTKFPEIQSRSTTVGKNSITAKPLETIFGMQGLVKNGMVKFVMGRKAKMNGIELGKEMGINTWAAFAGSDENAIVDGDFAMKEEELQPILRALRKGNINIVAIHNHMTMETPRLIFLHFWGNGQVEELAKTIREALQVTIP